VTQTLLVDYPLSGVVRLTLNRPEKKNALNNGLRGALFREFRKADADQGTSVVIIRGAGDCFSSGYDLGEKREPTEREATVSEGWWSRLAVTNWFEMWDFSVVFIAQVHGFCLAGASELVAACDLAYVSDDARIGYPPVRRISPPATAWQPWLLGARHGMEALLTGDLMTGRQSAEWGFANRSLPAGELEEEVLRVAGRVASVPPDLTAHNKRVGRRMIDSTGVRDGLRWAADLQPLAFHSKSSKEYSRSLRDDGVAKGIEGLRPT
jgi:enoyl-CoA hydratase